MTFFANRAIRIAAAVALGLTVAGAARAGPTGYFGVIIASEHFGEDSLNEFNPGLSFGRRWRSGGRTDVFVEGGIVRNSYDEIGPFLVGGLDWRVFRTGERGELRLGVLAGTAYYDALSEELEAEYGIPNAYGMVPVAGVAVSWRRGKTSVRLTGLPVSDGDLDGAAVLSLAFAY